MLVRLVNKKERLESIVCSLVRLASMECSLVRWASTKGTLVNIDQHCYMRKELWSMNCSYSHSVRHNRFCVTAKIQHELAKTSRETSTKSSF
jgi:hypothetical protein